MTSLNLAALRQANKDRLPLFKNNKGQPAHSQPDGSDWTPTEWLIALMGEVGEVALEIERPSDELFKAHELADVQIYLDILAQRILDKEAPRPQLGGKREYADYTLMGLIVGVGRLCEAYKKHIRGDIDEVEYREKVERFFIETNRDLNAHLNSVVKQAGTTLVGRGVDLAEATITKFNKTSDKVKAGVKLAEESATPPPPPEGQPERPWKVVGADIMPVGKFMEVQWQDGKVAVVQYVNGRFEDAYHVVYAPPSHWRMPKDTKA